MTTNIWLSGGRVDGADVGNRNIDGELKLEMKGSAYSLESYRYYCTLIY